MDRGHVLRRLVHMSSPIFLIYYWLPEPLWAGGPGRQLGLVFALFVTLVFESIRMTKQLNIIGMRPYESSRMSAAAWAGIALVIAFLFFPVEVSAPAIFGMAWIDPLCGELRKRNSRLYPNLPKIAYFVLVMAIMIATVGLSVGVVVAAALIVIAIVFFAFGV
jgi:hypothetical protein